MDTQALIDPCALEKLAKYGPPGFIAKLVAMFEQNAGKQLEQIRQALAEGSGEHTSFAAHAMKSSAGQVGAIEAHRLLSQIEALGKEGHLDEAQDAFAALSDILPGSIQQLRLIAGITSP